MTIKKKMIAELHDIEDENGTVFHYLSYQIKTTNSFTNFFQRPDIRFAMFQEEDDKIIQDIKRKNIDIDKRRIVNSYSQDGQVFQELAVNENPDCNIAYLSARLYEAMYADIVDKDQTLTSSIQQIKDKTERYCPEQQVEMLKNAADDMLIRYGLANDDSSKNKPNDQNYQVA